MTDPIPPSIEIPSTEKDQRPVLERVLHPQIVALEISELWVDGGTLWQWSQSSGFPTALRKAMLTLRAGGTSHADAVPPVAAGFEAIFMTGGRIEDKELRAELSNSACAVFFGEEPLFASERGGFDLLSARGLSGWVADLGKSQLKLAAPGFRWVFPRDWTRLRMAGQVCPAEVPAQRRRVRQFIALGLQIAMAETNQRPQAVVFALPTRVADDGTPSSSSYAGMREDRTLLSDALELAGLKDSALLVLNDAELAAISALSDSRLTGFQKVLVLTLGFGIGAAMINRSR